MGDKINSLDKLFKSTLSKHTVTPEPEVWEKLSSRLDNNDKAGVFIWWRWVAVAAIGVISFWLFHQTNFNESKNIASVSVTDTRISEKTPISMSPSQNVIEKEKTNINEPEAASPAVSIKTRSPKRNLSNIVETLSNYSEVKKEPVTNIKRTIAQLPIALEEISDVKRDAFTVTFNEKTQLNPKNGLKTLKDNPNSDIKVKIISNGYAIQPEKEKLVEELENKIGGFFTKVDEGFGDLQDAKNNLFAALTTTRDKRKKQTN